MCEGLWKISERLALRTDLFRVQTQMHLLELQTRIRQALPDSGIC